MKKLLMLGTSKGSCEMIRYAELQNIYTIVTDPRSPEKSKAKQIANEYWMIDTVDVDTLEKKCRENNIDGICCGISTFCIPSVMELCKRLKLSTYASPEAWQYTINKYDFKNLCKSNNVPTAKDYYVSYEPTENELKDIVYPVVVKAVDQSSNRGMSYCYSDKDVIKAVKYAHSISKNNRVIVEKMLDGIEYGAHYAIANGKASMFSFVSMLSQPGQPGNCYSITTTVANHLDKFLEEVNPYFIKALEKGGMKEGVCWIELILDRDNHFYVLEMGYRMSGDMMAIPLKNVTGFDSYKWMVDIAMGVKHERKDLPSEQIQIPSRKGCSYILWSNEKRGQVSKIEGVDKILMIPGVAVEYDVYPGEEFVPHQYLVTFLFDTNTVEEMIELIKKINDTVKIVDEYGSNIVIYYNDYARLREIDRDSLELKDK